MQLRLIMDEWWLDCAFGQLDAASCENRHLGDAVTVEAIVITAVECIKGRMLLLLSTRSNARAMLEKDLKQRSREATFE